MINKLIIPIIVFLATIPIALADSVFSNPAFDTVLILLFAAIIFFALRQLIGKIK